MNSHSESPVDLIGDKGARELRAEIEALKYENNKLRSINEVLVRRVELGWGNFSAAYTSFERSAMLAEQVESKSKALEQTKYQLDEAEQDLSHTKQQLNDLSDRLLDLIEGVTDGIALFDANRILVMANASFYQFWQSKGARIEAMRTTLPELSRLAVQYGFLDSSGLGDSQDGGWSLDNVVFQIADGRWLKMSEYPTRDGGLAVICSDVSAVKAGESRLRTLAAQKHDDMLRDMLNNLPQGVALVDDNGQLSAWNTQFMDLLSLPSNALVRGVPYRGMMARSAVGRRLLSDDDLLPPCDPHLGACQSEARLDDGRVLEVQTHPLPSKAFVLTVTDVTERNRDASVIRDSARRLRLMTDALPALIAYINQHGQFEFANRRAEEWYERPRNKIEQQSARDVLGSAEYERQSDYFTRALSGHSVSFEVEQTMPNGRKRIFTKNFVPNRDDHGDVLGFYALEQDVTEQRRTATALKHAYRHMEQRVFERTRELSELNDKLQAEVTERALIEQELLRAKRLAELANESKVKFMAATGHDLLQPMNAARLFAASILDEPLPPDTARVARSLSRSLDDVESIITTLVDISKLEAGVVEPSPESFRINDLLQVLADEFAVQAKEVGLTFRCLPSSAVVHTDSQLLGRILRNFLTNALRYTDEGRIVLGCRRRKNSLVIEVADSGIGIAEDQLKLIFGEFQRVEGAQIREQKGLGLGLAIVDKLSAVMGCEVRVRSLPSKGSIFSVEVPLGTLSDRAPLMPEFSLPDTLQGKCILVVDNDKAILDGMGGLLARWGCEVVTAFDQHSLEERLETCQPDLAIFDYQLDDHVTGFDLLNEVSLQERDIPIIMITANYSKELREQVIDRGFQLLHKPIKPLKLRNLMSRLLAR
jgi:PAS domain S-box-containing protein